MTMHLTPNEAEVGACVSHTKYFFLLFYETHYLLILKKYRLIK